MKQEDKLYADWLAELKKRQPVLNHSEELTADILQRISKNDSRRKSRKFMICIWTSGVAASFLFFLFLNEAFFAPNSFHGNSESLYDRHWQKSAFTSLPDNWEEMRLIDKSTYLSSQYKRLRQLRQKQISKIIKNKD